MAGVGFELKKLFRARTVAGYLKALFFFCTDYDGTIYPAYGNGIGCTAFVSLVSSSQL